MNLIKATIDGNPVAILSRFRAFGSKHVAQGQSVELRKDGEYYIGLGRTEWEWTIDRNGARVQDRGSNFRVKPPEVHDSDVAFFAPCDPNRGFPDEAIEKAVAVRVGDKVVIDCRIEKKKVAATVTLVDELNFSIRVDRVAPDKSSGSIVTTEGDNFVGFVSSATGVCVPNIPFVGAPSPTPTPIPPQSDIDLAVAAARAEERAQFRDMLVALSKQY